MDVPQEINKGFIKFFLSKTTSIECMVKGAYIKNNFSVLEAFDKFLTFNSPFLDQEESLRIYLYQ